MTTTTTVTSSGKAQKKLAKYVRETFFQGYNLGYLSLAVYCDGRRSGYFCTLFFAQVNTALC